MNVRKTNGSIEEFDNQKIKDSICRAYESAGEPCDDLMLNSIVNNLFLYDNVNTEEIRRQVENALMSINKKVAKCFTEKYADTKDIRKKQDFIKEYIAASNAATGSKFDSNANVSNKNIVTLGQELYKENNIKQNRYILCDKIRKMYSKKLSEQYLKDLESHVLYKHDESGTPGYPYCVAITMYPFLVDGLKKLGGESTAPTSLKSYCGEFINLVYSVSSQFLGACMYKDQTIMVSENAVPRIYTSKDFVEKYLGNTPMKFSNYQGEWEYSILPNGLKILEDGRQVNLKKVYRRKYDNDIFEITTKNGYKARVSKDHIFKQLYKGKTFEVKASELSVGDTVFVNTDYTSMINFDTVDYKEGWLIGMLCGDGCLTKEDTVELSVKYQQECFGDIFNEYSKEIYGYELNKSNGHRCFCYSKYNKEYKNLITENIKGSSSYDKFISLDGKSLDYVAGFLDGIFCSDGSYTKGHGITITLANEKLANVIHEAVKLFGINSKIKEVVPKNNRKVSYSQYISSRILKYLKHIHLKPIMQGKEIVDESRELYHYGHNARAKAGRNYATWGDTKPAHMYKTEVIESIKKFLNDDEYVYEVETETHWYNCGGFITHNCATPEFLMYFDYFLRKDYGDEYVEKLDNVVELTQNGKKLIDVIDNCFQQVVHSMNMPAGNRG